ncbi:MAG: hypothetical protein U9O94_00170 [Nanoarchaeota archaeon]|nr:hypothetical protein [Nanoarchaeota archaeon]
MTIEQDVRAALTTTTNVTSGFDATYGVEIMKAVDRNIQEILDNRTPLISLVDRKPIAGQIGYHWNIRTANNSSSTFYADGGNGTAATGSKVQLIAIAKPFRTDWEVTNLSKAAMSSYFDAMADEISNAAIEHGNLEEKQIIGGTDTGAYGDADGFLGMKQLLNSYVTLSDTTSVFGIARASGKTYLDCQLVNAGSTDLALSHLDAADTAIKKKGGSAWMFLVSYDKQDEISALLQSQQRFNDRVQVAGGFEVISYRGALIVPSAYMDKFGASDTDTAVAVLGKGIWEMRVLKETSNHPADLGRYDSVGGFLTTYEVLVCKDLTKNCLIYGLNV